MCTLRYVPEGLAFQMDLSKGELKRGGKFKRVKKIIRGLCRRYSQSLFDTCWDTPRFVRENVCHPFLATASYFEVARLIF